MLELRASMPAAAGGKGRVGGNTFPAGHIGTRHSACQGREALIQPLVLPVILLKGRSR
jgi:hypothetical protein